MVRLLDPGTTHMILVLHLQPGQEVWTFSWSISVQRNLSDMGSAGSLLVSSTRVGISEKSSQLLCSSCLTEFLGKTN